MNLHPTTLPRLDPTKQYRRCGHVTRRGEPCRRLVRPGETLCAKHRPDAGPTFWTEARRFQLLSLTEDGLSTEQIADTLGVTVGSVQCARLAYEIPHRAEVHLSQERLCERLAVLPGAIQQWIDEGLLGCLARPSGQGRVVLVSEAQVLDFLEDPRTWHMWTTDQITWRPWRQFGERARGDVRYLLVAEVADRMCCCPSNVLRWIAEGRLAGRFYRRRWYVLETDLARFELPKLGGDRRSKAARS